MCIGHENIVLVLYYSQRQIMALSMETVDIELDFRHFSLAAWTLLVINILCASFCFNPQNILVSVFLWLSFGFIYQT